jgi:hypothetical protein
MKFFIPAAEDEKQAERVYISIAKFVQAPILKNRIYKLSWIHNGKQMNCEIGKNIVGDSRFNQEPVVAIFDCGDLYKICTANRGVIRGEPILAGAGYDSFPTYFDKI